MSEVKQRLFEQLAFIGQSLASPQRIECLDYLAQAERSVEELSQLTQLSLANTSRHLQQLKHAGLVQMRKQGKHRFYRLAGKEVVLLVQQLRVTAENYLSEVDRLVHSLEGSGTVKTIPVEEVSKNLASNKYLLLDVRPEKEYAQGHILGAINVPPNQMDACLADLPSEKPIVAYCRGPYCVYAHQLVQKLAVTGVTAMKLQVGYPEWQALDLAVETPPTLSN